MLNASHLNCTLYTPVLYSCWQDRWAAPCCQWLGAKGDKTQRVGVCCLVSGTCVRQIQCLGRNAWTSCDATHASGQCIQPTMMLHTLTSVFKHTHAVAQLLVLQSVHHVMSQKIMWRPDKRWYYYPHNDFLIIFLYIYTWYIYVVFSWGPSIVNSTRLL